MSAHRVFGKIVVWCALLVAPRPLLGQLSIYPVQDLTFGQIPAGSPTSVLVTDASRRAELEISGRGTFTLNVILPTQMVSLQGDQFPITFSSSDGMIYLPRFRWSLPFDPTTPTSIWIPRWERGAQVYLGGTATPGSSQPPGLYAATITVQIINAGT